jgi:hypothetical protein
MKGLEIDCFYHSETTASLKDLEIQYSLADCDVRPIMFYDIDAISSYSDGEGEYSCIHSNGCEFTTILSYNELKTAIEQWH